MILTFQKFNEISERKQVCFQPPEKTSDILRDNAVDNSVHNAHALSYLPRVKQQAKQLQSSCCAKLWC